MRQLKKGLCYLLITLSVLMCGPLTRASVAGDLFNIQHQVLAFYYGWYDKSDWAKKARWTPQDGSYMSLDSVVVERQMIEAKKAGITGLIASWWPRRNQYTDAQIPTLLAAAQRNRLLVSVLVEDFGELKKTQDGIYSDLDYILTHYSRHPAWLKVDGRPVIFIYGRAIHALPTAAQWNLVLLRVRHSHPGAIILSDGQGNLNYNPQAKASFDGLFSYGTTTRVHDRSLTEAREILGKADKDFVVHSGVGELACLVVSPGYDDSKTDRPKPRPFTDRFNGETYKADWAAALEAKPDWILIATFNEWMEGSQIEPSIEFGMQALDDTAKFSRSFVNSVTRDAR